MIVAIGVLGGFSFIVTQMISHQTNLKKLAEVKAAMNTLLVHAQYATKRYEILHLEAEIANRAGLEDCFKSRGIDCQNQNVAPPVFPAGSLGEADMNNLLRGEYTLEGRRCNAGENCPIQVATEWVFICQPNVCSTIRFSNTVTINPALADNTSLIPLLSSIPAISGESEYAARKSIGLVNTLSSNCGSATGVNFGSGAIGCAPTNGTTTNELFSSQLGFNFQNTNARLIAMDAAGSSSSANSCPDGTVATMQNGVIVCSTEPTVLCTNQGWVVKNSVCCNPTIPGGGDGWTGWSSCSKSCGGGTQSRSCQYSQTSYCDSTCSTGQTETRACNTQACTCANGRVNYPACTQCPPGTQDKCGTCKPQSCNNDNGGSVSVNARSTWTKDYVMGGNDRTEYGGISGSCSASRTYDGGVCAMDRVRVTCRNTSNSRRTMRYQLRRCRF